MTKVPAPPSMTWMKAHADDDCCFLGRRGGQASRQTAVAMALGGHCGGRRGPGEHAREAACLASDSWRWGDMIG